MATFMGYEYNTFKEGLAVFEVTMGRKPYVEEENMLRDFLEAEKENMLRDFLTAEQPEEREVKHLAFREVKHLAISIDNLTGCGKRRLP